ncbi:MAG: toprim domain-containing protein, partial [Pseudomonadota bacterium]
CQNPNRLRDRLCIVENVSDCWAIERAHIYKGLYHVLGGVLSPLDHIGPNELNLDKLFKRCAQSDIKEVILATNLTVDGQTTAHYIAKQLAHYDVTITRLAHGVPAGGELDFIDEGTLRAALESRSQFDY